MLFGLVGCGKNKSAEDIAENYLRKTYHKEFVVEELTKKNAGPFMTTEYSGYAYEKENPENRFKVWVNKDRAKVSDAYYGITVLSEIKNWILFEATTVWENVNVGVVLDVIRPNSNVEYKENEFYTFLENESVECDAYLFVKSKEELTIENYSRFDEAINKQISGFVHIFVLTDCDPASIDFVDYIGNTPNASIRIGAPASVIEERLQLGGD